MIKKKLSKLPLLLALGIIATSVPMNVFAADMTETTIDESVAMTDVARPAPNGVMLDAENKFPYLGMSFKLQHQVLEAINEHKIFVDAGGGYDIVGNFEYGYVLFTAIPKDQQKKIPGSNNDEALTIYDDFVNWIKNDTAQLGQLSVYSSEYLDGKDIIELTGMANNEELEVIGDYHFYFSTPDVTAITNEEHIKFIEKYNDDIAMIKEDATFNEPRARDDNFAGFATVDTPELSNIGFFAARDLNNELVTEEIFADADLTVVNIWSTWCGPCVEELPHLGKLSKEMKDSGVQFIGIAADTFDQDILGRDEEMVKIAKKIIKKSKVKYPVLVPDTDLYTGLLSGVQAFPTTFFVDKDGNLVGEPVMGAMDKDEWKKTIDDVLDMINKK